MADLHCSPVRCRVIPGYPDYQISDDGRVWKRENSRLRPVLRRKYDDGYLRVRLPGRTVLVHRLVLEAFVGPCPPGRHCRHLNGDRADNRLTNLCWGMAAENAADKVRHGTLPRGETHPAAKLSEADVRAIRALWRAQKRRRHAARSARLTQAQIGRRYGVTAPIVSLIVNRKIWTHV